jgi:integrase
VGNRVVRLRRAPPPTFSDPYAQVKWIFFQVEAEHVEPRAASFRHAKNKYVEFLSQTNAYYPELIHDPRFYLESYWEADALIRFNKWLMNLDLRSKSRYALYKNVRRVMDVAYALRVIDHIVYHAPMFKGVSETKVRAAYGKREQEVINAAVARWIDLANAVLQGYAPSEKGIPHQRVNFLSSIEIDGRMVEVKDAAVAFGIQHSVITGRLKQGWTPRQAVGLDPSPKALSSMWIIEGTTYESAEAVSRHFGINSSVISYRKRKGWTPEQIVGIEPKPQATKSGVTERGRSITIDGHRFASLREAATHYGIARSVLKSRISAGWTPREAVELDERASLGTRVAVDGVQYESISAAAKAFGMGRATVCERLRRGCSPEQALGLQPITVSRSDDRSLLWRFENEYGCDARAMLEDLRRRRNKLSDTFSEKRLRRLFMRWGVWPYVDDRLVMPLAIEMSMLTGLNVESLKMLEIESYVREHRLTGQPVITYPKRRSASVTRSEERELHVPLLELEELYLDETAVERVDQLVSLVVAVTSEIRADAPPELARRLFIFEDVERSRKLGGRVVVPLDPHGKVIVWYRRFAREEGLYDVFGPRFNFNLSRCRPTLATNMVLAGASLFQVQAILGHGHIQTTANYLDERRLTPLFHRTIAEALEGISRRSLEIINSPEKCPVSDTGWRSPTELGFIETLSGCGCTDPYDPSPYVREATHFKPGSVCKYWNMCLLCDGSVVTENSLPKLILYRHRVSAALADDSPAIKPRESLYKDVLKLIDGIIEPDVIFSADVIESARYTAASMDDVLVDQLIYQGL